MKLGIVCRSENRGLGNLSRDYYENLHPDKTLVVIPAGRHGLTSHLDWYPDAALVRFNGQLNRRICEEWLDGLDAVLSFETFYDWRFCGWAHDMQVATVCMAMPEYWRPAWSRWPTQWWAPTTWRLDRLPARHVPVPVPQTCLTKTASDGPFRWLHVGGARLPDELAHADRNGTHAVVEAARLVRQPQTITITTQSPLVPQEDVTVLQGNVENRWDIYTDADALILPRRYAGLSLPVLEAFAVGLPVVMTDMTPQNTDWPVHTTLTRPGRPHRLFGAEIPTGDADPQALAQTMDSWATDSDLVARWRQKAVEYATANSWDIRAPQIRAELERAADLAVT